MGSSAITATGIPAVAGGVRTNWIISRRDDLVWFIGSGAISYLALAMMAAGFPITPIYLIWMMGVDGPHVIATVTRTYFDREERQRLGWLLWSIVPFLAAGPVMVALGQASLFYLFAVCWQHFHIAKQHFGLMMLWKAKNKERDAFDLKLDRWFLLSSAILPLAIFVERTRLAKWTAAGQIEVAAIGLYAILAACFIGRQVQKWRAGLALNAPKLGLLAMLVPMQWLAFLHAAHFGPDGILRAGITLGLFHSFQYHRLIWFHNRNRYTGPDAREKHGLAAFFAKGVGYYLLLALGVQFLLSTLPQTLAPAAEWMKAALWGIPFTHYLLDSKIWRVRGNKELAAALKL
ncbi:MAG TPA: hypothetical protein VGP79_18370 [Bryobacteraceae bacterium]|jgi:hypothetical protein|nr:hypothetical protein [Bryobacteraceae bacterium]